MLLFRQYFAPDGPLRVGLAGLAQLVVVARDRFRAGRADHPAGQPADRVPPLLRRGADRRRASIQLVLVLPYRLPLYLAAALLLGFCAQALKICVDTLVQRHVDDEFRGRVFALYDMLFNVALVLAAVLTALVLPADGRSPVSVVVVALAYLVTAAVYLRASVRPAAAPTSA